MLRSCLITIMLMFSASVMAAEHWIDVRIAEQYQAEHIKGAINIPLRQLKEQIVSQISNKDDTLHLYCNSGRQSGMAKQILQDMGYTQVLDEGGISGIDLPKESQHGG
ncbi:thiosulfate sulfurtransferase PspE [Budviciaceae bacterium CWB-B4]|uniref:Thiosulfate sulfurtransferase PspE n=1 Tax=Limnobaculum xujianqingii TaxID=2738837 RepID=A0A9D7AKK8_9GAMM|nr:thiosulfate sulfurtransferase PspE [Limnobaculum xujianqingii]MBK5074529.1 thiosulfate sulfurtransferase PspE [Limnobaculum xujianqingii]MBK5177805.1 thiosulfate sulfurtransferase PspE [Limnobaculum xujianqingii]